MVHRTDSNQIEIVNALRQIGCTVNSLAAVGNGIPDIIVGVSGHNLLMEIKTPTGRLTPDQKTWHADWRGQKAIVVTVQDAVDVVNEARKR